MKRVLVEYKIVEVRTSRTQTRFHPCQHHSQLGGYDMTERLWEPKKDGSIMHSILSKICNFTGLSSRRKGLQAASKQNRKGHTGLGTAQDLMELNRRFGYHAGIMFSNHRVFNHPFREVKISKRHPRSSNVAELREVRNEDADTPDTSFTWPSPPAK